TAGDEDHPGEAAAGPTGPAHLLRQLLQGIAGEGVAIAMGDAVELGLDGLVDLLIAMAEAEDGGPAGAVDILLAVGVVEIAALARGDLRQLRGRPDRLHRGAHASLSQYS